MGIYSCNRGMVDCIGFPDCKHGQDIPANMMMLNLFMLNLHALFNKPANIQGQALGHVFFVLQEHGGSQSATQRMSCDGKPLRGVMMATFHKMKLCLGDTTLQGFCAVEDRPIGT